MPPERQTALTRKLIAQGLKLNRTPFDFNRRVTLARSYLDDGALFTCADILEALAAELRAAAEARNEALRQAG